MMQTQPWMISLHGGHSSDYCEHAESSLQEMLDAAVNAGYSVFGVSEHAPRVDEKFIYPDELIKGWTVEKQVQTFHQYAADLRALQAEYADRLRILRGFEAEVVPEDRYLEVMLGFREELAFDYMVGSVHFVNGYAIDYSRAVFDEAAAALGGPEALAVRYYEVVQEMVGRLSPEVVGHLDLICKCAPDEESVSTPAVKHAAFRTLEVIAQHGCILDINTAGYRKQLKRPYVAPWLVDAANQLGIGMCFGDDSHRVADVGAGIEDARQYLLENGVTEIRCVGGPDSIPLT